MSMHQEDTKISTSRLKGFKRLNDDASLAFARRKSISIRKAYQEHPEFRSVELAYALSKYATKSLGPRIYMVPQNQVGFIPQVHDVEHWTKHSMVFRRRHGKAKVTLHTGSHLDDCVYDRGNVYLWAYTQLENVVHEVAHMCVASRDRLARVNYGTYRPGVLSYDTVQGSDFIAQRNNHESEACRAEVVFLHAVEWKGALRRADSLHSTEVLSRQELYDKTLAKWDTLLGCHPKEWADRVLKSAS